MLRKRGERPVTVRVLAIALLAAAVFISSAAVAQEPQFVQVIGVDSYAKDVRAGQSAMYNWTLRSVETVESLTVVVDATISGTGWSAAVVSADTFVLGPGDLGSVSVTVTAPSERGSVSSNMTVSFHVYADGYLVQVTSRSAHTTIIGPFASADKVLGHFDNPLPAPLNNEWGVFILDLAIWLGIAFGVAYIMDAIARTFTKRTTTMIDDIVIRILRTPLLLLIFVFGVVQSLDALHRHIPDDIRALLLRLYGIILIFVIFYLSYKLFKEILVYYGKIIAKRTASKIDDVLIPVVEKIGVVVIGIAALAYLLDVLTIDLTVFIAGGVVVSMVLAFAAQETISNFFSGVFLLLDRPFVEGDTIILPDNNWYEVRRIGLRTARLYRYVDAVIVSIPNNQLVNQQVARYSNVKDPARVNIDVGVAYGTDPKKAREAIMRAIRGNEHVLLTEPTREPFILFNAMGDNALQFRVWAFVADRSKRIAVMDRLTEDIYRRLTEAGIEIPFPQRTVWIRKEGAEEQKTK